MIGVSPHQTWYRSVPQVWDPLALYVRYLQGLQWKISNLSSILSGLTEQNFPNCIPSLVATRAVNRYPCHITTCFLSGDRSHRLLIFPNSSPKFHTREKPPKFPPKFQHHSHFYGLVFQLHRSVANLKEAFNGQQHCLSSYQIWYKLVPQLQEPLRQRAP